MGDYPVSTVGTTLSLLRRSASDRFLIHYELDHEDRIRSVDGRWNEFASENGAPHLAREAVLGRPIWDFVIGEETIYLWRSVFARVRSDQGVLRFPFRCDSPTIRRYLQLSIAPLVDGCLDIFSLSLREEERPYVALLDSDVERSNALVKVCDWCQRVQADDEWVHIEVALDRLGLATPLPRLSHGVCEACRPRLESDT